MKVPASQITGIDYPGKHGPGSMVILSFDNGEKLVYKNRDLRIDAHLFGESLNQDNVAGQLNQWLGAFPGIATHKILPLCDSHHYGYAQWMENNNEVLTDDQVTGYYRRMGVLCGLAVMTGLGDLHHLNLISDAGKPYVIDAQTAFHSSVIRALEEGMGNPLMALPGGRTILYLIKPGSGRCGNLSYRRGELLQRDTE